jgi:hypothetical protein
VADPAQAGRKICPEAVRGSELSARLMSLNEIHVNAGEPTFASRAREF